MDHHNDYTWRTQFFAVMQYVSIIFKYDH